MPATDDSQWFYHIQSCFCNERLLSRRGGYFRHPIGV